jgi:hypothetical protein
VEGRAAAQEYAGYYFNRSIHARYGGGATMSTQPPRRTLSLTTQTRV